MNPVRDLQAELQQFFAYLEADFGFALTSFSDQPRVFDNFQAVYSRSTIDIRITRDRSQLFVELCYKNGKWHQKESLLRTLGIPMSRFPTRANGIWSGYDAENQSTDLKQYLAILIDNLQHAAQPIIPPDAAR